MRLARICAFLRSGIYLLMQSLHGGLKSGGAQEQHNRIGVSSVVHTESSQEAFISHLAHFNGPLILFA